MLTRSYIKNILNVLCFIAIVLNLSHCLKVDPVNKPNAHETYQGEMKVNFAIPALNPGVRGVNFGVFTTNEDGTKVTISQLPNLSFEIIPKDLFSSIVKIVQQLPSFEETDLFGYIDSIDLERIHPMAKTQIQPNNELFAQFVLPPTVFGLVGDIDGKIITVNGFDGKNEMVDILECSVSGQIKQTGDAYVTLGNGIAFFCDTDAMIEFFGADPFKILLNKAKNKSVAESEGKTIFFEMHIELDQPISVTS